MIRYGSYDLGDVKKYVLSIKQQAEICRTDSLLNHTVSEKKREALRLYGTLFHEMYVMCALVCLFILKCKIKSLKRFHIIPCQSLAASLIQTRGDLNSVGEGPGIRS